MTQNIYGVSIHVAKELSYKPHRLFLRETQELIGVAGEKLDISFQCLHLARSIILKEKAALCLKAIDD